MPEKMPLWHKMSNSAPINGPTCPILTCYCMTQIVQKPHKNGPLSDLCETAPLFQKFLTPFKQFCKVCVAFLHDQINLQPIKLKTHDKDH